MKKFNSPQQIEKVGSEKKCKHEKESYVRIMYFNRGCEEYNICRNCGHDGPKFLPDIMKAEEK